MNKRKIVLLAVALCMVAILGFGSTLAYLTDTEQVTNTMVIGDVKINIEELAYVDGEWQDFVDDKFTLYPVGNDVATRSNKVVYTFNTSKVNDKDAASGKAYIRTILLFEANDSLPADYKNDGTCCDPMQGIHFAYTSTTSGIYVGSQNTVLPAPVEVDGNKYWVVICTAADEKPIASGHALAAMHSVWVDKNINSTQMAAWGNNDEEGEGKLEILVFSQAIQAEGLTHAEAMKELGEVTDVKLNEWFGKDDATINDIF